MAGRRGAEQQRFTLLSALFAVALFIALVVCASGFLSLFTDSGVLVESDVGPIVAPSMVAASAAALLVILLSLADRAMGAGALVVWTVIAGVVTGFAYLAAGATLYSLGSGEPLRGLIFFSANAVTGYATAVAVIAAVIAFAFFLLVAQRAGGGARRTPRWPWEKRDDEGRRQR